LLSKYKYFYNINVYYIIVFIFKAAEFLYSGETLSAIRAKDFGLVNALVDDGISGRDQLIKKIKTTIVVYKKVNIISYSFKNNILHYKYISIVFKFSSL
jgi:enoyl-CoA hydratase/carnithine racemase